MSKNIKFYPEDVRYEGWFDEPVPAKKLIPEWYKEQSKYIDSKKEMLDSGLFNSTIKACMPVFDVMTAGYIIKTPVDLNIEIDKSLNVPKISWSINNFIPIEEHGIKQLDKFNIKDEYHTIAYKFLNNWMVKTPKGYSSIFMTPVFRNDLPFFCLPGIVDTDTHPRAVNFPFFLRKDFEGIIYKGTPLMQIIPFKREEWTHKIKKHDAKFDMAWKQAEGTIENRYKKYFRSMKEW